MHPHGLPEGITIRPPTAAERRACRMLLPAATGSAQRSRLYVAVTHEAQPRVVGAAALGLDAGREMRREWLVDLRVIVPFRRRGIGRALIEQVIAQARAHGIPALHAWEWVEPEGEAARAWAALGFVPARRRFELEADLARANEILTPLYDRMWEENWVPAGARIVPLADADAEAVAALHVEYLGGSRRLLMPRLRGTARSDSFDPHFSRVLLLDGRVVGFTLGRVLTGGAVCEVDANVLHPLVRLGWANLWLKLEAGRLLMAAGVRTIRYFSFEQHTDTRRITRQAGGRVVATLVRMCRNIAETSLTIDAPAPPGGAGGAGA